MLIKFFATFSCSSEVGFCCYNNKYIGTGCRNGSNLYIVIVQKWVKKTKTCIMKVKVVINLGASSGVNNLPGIIAFCQEN